MYTDAKPSAVSIPTTNRFISSRLRSLIATSTQRTTAATSDREEEDEQRQESAPAGRGSFGLGRRIGWRASAGLLDRLLERPFVRLVGLVGELEGDDGDVVLAAGLVRAADELVRGVVEAFAPLASTSPISSSPTMSVSPSEQSTKTSPSCRLDGERVDVDVGIGAERARDHRALRVVLGLLGGELAAAHELRDERVVVRQLLELAVAQDVRARVADVAERHAAVLDERDGHRRAHARDLGVAARALVDAAVRLLDQRDDALLAAAVRLARLHAAAAARPDATSPARAPPIPSAIANSGGSQT